MSRIRSTPIAAALLGLLGATVGALAVGVPTDVVPNPWFTRMTPVRTQDYIFLILAVVLSGLLTASYALPRLAACTTQQGKAVTGGMLSFFAIGCPVCNKLVILALGVSGALRYFEPIQPLLGILSLVLLGVAVWLRWRTILVARTVAEPLMRDRF